MKVSFLMCLLSLIYSTYAQVSFTIKGKVNVAEPTSERLKEITVSLENTDKIAYINTDGVFVFNKVEPGHYFIHVNDNAFVYQKMFVEVTKKEVKAYEYSYKSGKGIKHKMIELNAISPIKYSEDSPSMISSLIKNPYVLMIGVPLIFFGLSKMVPQEDLKAQSEEFNKQFKSMKDNFGFFK